MTNSRKTFLPGNRFLLGYLAFLSAFAPLSTDMYLPALPSMGANLNTSNELTSYTISIFLFVFSFSMLLWGPVSDKYGRKPVLVWGSVLFIFSSSFIALSNSIWAVLIGRAIQAIGSGAASSISLAIVKDIFRGKAMERIVSIIQAATILAPMLAPVIGGGLLYFINWRGIFWCLAFCGCVSLAGAFSLKETAPLNHSLTLLETFKRIIVVLKISSFRNLLIIFSMMAMPFMAYLGVCAFIYQDFFHLSAQSFSMFFAFNALISLFGPILYLYFLAHVNRTWLITLLIGGIIISGILILFFGAINQWIFAIIFAFITFCGSALRPPSTVMMMESIKGDNGIVTALINCGGLMCGSLSMFITGLAFWPNPIISVGIIGMTIGGLSLFQWLVYIKKASG